VADNGISVWLDCSFDLVQRRVAQQHAPVRPLARDAERFAALYDARRDAYRLADVRVEIASDDPENTVDAILADPVFK
jgi:shikimate kinase